MNDYNDYIMSISFGIIAISLLIIASCAGYALTKEAKNPKDFKTYEINGNIPTLTLKGI